MAEPLIPQGEIRLDPSGGAERGTTLAAYAPADRRVLPDGWGTADMAAVPHLNCCTMADRERGVPPPAGPSPPLPPSQPTPGTDQDSLGPAGPFYDIILNRCKGCHRLLQLCPPASSSLILAFSLGYSMSRELRASSRLA